MMRSLLGILGAGLFSAAVLAQSAPGVAGVSSDPAELLAGWSGAVRQVHDEARVRLVWLEAYIAQADLAASWREQQAVVGQVAAAAAPQSMPAYGVYERLRRSVFEALGLSPHLVTQLEAADRARADWAAMEQIEMRIAAAESFLEKQGRYRESRQWIQTQVRGGGAVVGAGVPVPATTPSQARMAMVLSAQRRRMGGEVAVLQSGASVSPVGAYSRSSAVVWNRISQPARESRGIEQTGAVGQIAYGQLNSAPSMGNQGAMLQGTRLQSFLNTGVIFQSATPHGWVGVGNMSR